MTAPLASKVIGDHVVHHLGPLGSGPTLVVVGRNNFRKRSTAIESLLRALHEEGFSICWYEPIGARHARLRSCALDDIRQAWLHAFADRHPLTGKLVTKAIRLHLKIRYPKRRCHVWRRWADLPEPAENLRRFLQLLPASDVVLVSHSAGGIAASMAESHPSVRKLVCFGYPFRHPDKADEGYRTAHLSEASKPFLIIQGDRDDYGTAKDGQRYALSPHIELRSIDADHDYDAWPSFVADQVLQDVLRFLRC